MGLTYKANVAYQVKTVTLTYNIYTRKVGRCSFLASAHALRMTKNAGIAIYSFKECFIRLLTEHNLLS